MSNQTKEELQLDRLLDDYAEFKAVYPEPPSGYSEPADRKYERDTIKAKIEALRRRIALAKQVPA